ncbi:MAG: hypothetical protein AAGB51_09405 [Planctomycetota bacterium]
MTADDHETAFASLLADLPAHAEGTSHWTSGCLDAHGDEATVLLVESFLLWRTTPEHAQKAAKKLAAAVVDFNELRVCLPEEISEALGARFPDSAERAGRIRLTLNDVYQREHVTSVASTVSMTKREAKAYLDGLDGCPPFVAARVALIGVGAHAFPVDERIGGLLELSGALPAGVEPAQAAARLERQVRAGEALDAYLKLEAWTESPKPAKRSKPRKTASKSGR